MANLSRVSRISAISLLFIACSSVLVQSSNPGKEIPRTKLGVNGYIGPTLKFLYWALFEQYAKILHQKYPEISIEGDVYPPPNYNAVLAQALGAAKMLFIVCVLSGINIFNFFGQEQPSWYAWCIENKISACLMTFFLCNAIEGQLVSTGAFEISFNGIPQHLRSHWFCLIIWPQTIVESVIHSLNVKEIFIIFKFQMIKWQLFRIFWPQCDLFTWLTTLFLKNPLERGYVPVWSKLETGRIPQPPELFQIIDNQLHFGKEV